MLKSLKEIWSGFLVGAANIIPGVSGGTLLFLLGLYERTIAAISGFGGGRGAEFFKQICKTTLCVFRKDERSKLLKMSDALDIPFLIKLVCGAGLAILLLSDVMDYLLKNQFANTYAFFFGLIAISTFLCVKMLRVKKAILIIHVLIGAFVTVAMTLADDPVRTEEMRYERYKERMHSEQISSSANENNTLDANADNASTAFKYTGVFGSRDFTLAAASGLASVCAMILPGLSGSLLMILLGQYQSVINAVSNLKTLQLDYIIFLSVFGIGMVVGLLLFARAVEFIFKKFHDGTVAFLIGLMLGSLYALWPFKKVTAIGFISEQGDYIVGTMTVQTNINILPDNFLSAISAFVFCAAGVGIMLVLNKQRDVASD